jgi:4-amino-4-deoxy-L-arabinose transferase-like glycosyltransferase
VNDLNLDWLRRKVWASVASSCQDVALIVLTASSFTTDGRETARLASPIWQYTFSHTHAQWARCPESAPAGQKECGRLLTGRPTWRHDTRQPLSFSYSGVIPEHASRAVARSRLRTALIVGGVAALIVLPTLGHRIVATTDEARFVLYAREVLAQRKLFDVRLRGTFFREKPPLYAWTIAAFSLPGGQVTEATSQAPIALAALAAAVFTSLLGSRLFNPRVGLWAGLALATTFGFFRHSQILLPDMLVIAFATLAAYWFWRAMEDPADRRVRALFYVALAFALYAKGPLGLLPLLVGAIWLYGRDGLRGMAVRLWSPLGLLLFIVITLTWVVPFLAMGGGTYVHTVMWQDWLAAYTGGGPGRSLRRGASDALGFFAPWIVLLPLVLSRAVKAYRTPAVAYALLSFSVPLLIVLMSAHYRTRYLLAAAPGLALVVAWWADAHGADRTIVGRAIAWLGLAGIGAATALVAFPGLSGVRSSLQIPEPSLTLVPIVLFGWILALSLWVGLRRGRPALLVSGVTGAMMLLLLYGPWLDRERFSTDSDVPRLATRIEAYSRGGEPGVFRESGWLEIDYYLGRPLHEIWLDDDLERYLERTRQPVLASEATWGEIKDSRLWRVRTLERVKVRGKSFVILGWSPEP